MRERRKEQSDVEKRDYGKITTIFTKVFHLQKKQKNLALLLVFDFNSHHPDYPMLCDVLTRGLTRVKTLKKLLSDADDF